MLEERSGHTKHYFPALSGVRALAAYLVFFHHYNVTESLWPGLADQFNVGVSIFFVLSGFLMAYLYADEDALTKEYFISRFARIYPLYFIVTTLTFLLIQERSFSLYISNLTFFRGLSDQQLFSGVAQGWSLTPEVMFYLAAPFIFIFIRKNIKFLFLISLVFILMGLLLVHTWGALNEDGFMVSLKFMWRYTFFGRNIEFLMGVGVALLYKRPHRISFAPYATFLGFALMLLSMMALTVLHDSYATPFSWLNVCLKNLVQPAAIALFFWGLLHQSNGLTRLLGSRLLVLLGKSSYVFYLLHLGVLAQFLGQQIWVIFIGINLLSVVIYQWVEVPLNTYVKRLFIGRK